MISNVNEKPSSGGFAERVLIDIYDYTEGECFDSHEVYPQVRATAETLRRYWPGIHSRDILSAFFQGRK